LAELEYGRPVSAFTAGPGRVPFGAAAGRDTVELDEDPDARVVKALEREVPRIARIPGAQGVVPALELPFAALGGDQHRVEREPDDDRDRRDDHGHVQHGRLPVREALSGGCCASSGDRRSFFRSAGGRCGMRRIEVSARNADREE
jgi:hypothetical protein